jgi:hypothetical protein
LADCTTEKDAVAILKKIGDYLASPRDNNRNYCDLTAKPVKVGAVGKVGTLPGRE